MKKTVVILLVILTITLASCSSIVIEDTNGPDDHTLQTITDGNIIEGMNSSSLLKIRSKFNGKTSVQCKKLSGVETLYEKHLSFENLTLKVTSNVTSGNARLVMMFDNEIIYDFILNGTETIPMLNSYGTITIKIAGESAAYKVTIEETK